MWELITKSIGFFWERAAVLGSVLVFRVATALGIGYGTYSLLLPQMVDFVQGYLTGLPLWAVQLLGSLRVDEGLTLLFSAYAAKVGIRVRAIRLDTTGGNP